MVLNETIPGLLPLQSGGARRTLDKLIEKHGTKLFNCFEAGYSTFGGIQSIIFLPPLHKFAEIDPNDATRPVTINRVVYRVAKLKTFRTLPETAQTAPNFFLYKFIEELVQHFDYGVGMTGVEPPEFSSNFPGLDNPTKTKYDNDCFALLEITCRLYSIFYITIYAQQDLCLENNMRSGLYSRYVENRTTQPQFSVFMDEIIHALQSGESLQCLFGQNETNSDALEVLLEMMLEHGLLYTAAKLGLPIEKINILKGTRFFTGTTDFLTKLKSGFPSPPASPPYPPAGPSSPPASPPYPPASPPYPPAGPSSPPTGPTSPPTGPSSPPTGPSGSSPPLDESVKQLIITQLIFQVGREDIVFNTILQSKINDFISKNRGVTQKHIEDTLGEYSNTIGIRFNILDDITARTNNASNFHIYNAHGDGWCFYYSIFAQRDPVNIQEAKSPEAIQRRGDFVPTPEELTSVEHFIDFLRQNINNSRNKKSWKEFYNAAAARGAGAPTDAYEEYLTKMTNSREKEWAEPDYGVGQAAANVLSVRLDIYQYKKDSTTELFNIKTYIPEAMPITATISILYVNRNHYQILLPKTGAAPLPLPLPSPSTAPPPHSPKNTILFIIKKGESFPNDLGSPPTFNEKNPYSTKANIMDHTVSRLIQGNAYIHPTNWNDIKKKFIIDQIYYYKINNKDVTQVKRIDLVNKELQPLFNNNNIYNTAKESIVIEFAVEPELAALEARKSGGTRKIRRHHSYPLKHTFKNRRA